MKDVILSIHATTDRLILRGPSSFWAQNKIKIVTIHMESEIYDGNFSLPDYPEHADLSFSEDYNQIDGVPSGLSIDWSLLKRKIFESMLYFEVDFYFRGIAKNSWARNTWAVRFRGRWSKMDNYFFRSSISFQLRFLFVISIIGIVGNVLVLIDSAYFWKDYPSGHSLIVNLTVTGKTDEL